MTGAMDERRTLFDRWASTYDASVRDADFPFLGYDLTPLFVRYYARHRDHVTDCSHDSVGRVRLHAWAALAQHATLTSDRERRDRPVR